MTAAEAETHGCNSFWFDLVEGTHRALQGWGTPEGSLDLDGLDITNEDMEELFEIDTEALQTETSKLQTYFQQLGNRLPDRLAKQLDAQAARLADG